MKGWGALPTHRHAHTFLIHTRQLAARFYFNRLPAVASAPAWKGGKSIGTHTEVKMFYPHLASS